jgi:hypothetical protein
MGQSMMPITKEKKRILGIPKLINTSHTMLKTKWVKEVLVPLTLGIGKRSSFKLSRFLVPPINLPTLRQRPNLERSKTKPITCIKN